MAEEGNRALNVIQDTSIAYLVQLGLDKVFSLLQNSLGSLWGGEEELEKIKSSLKTIHRVIGSAEERPLKDLALVDWLEKLKDAAYDAEDVLDEYATRELRWKMEGQNSNSFRDPSRNKVRKISLLNFPVLKSTNMNLKLKDIRKRLESIEEESHKFQLSERVQNWERQFKKHRQTHSLVEESKVYGRNEEKEEIVNLLLLPVAGHEDEEVSVIPIVGMGGLGKTTLAKLVFNDGRVKNHFQLKMWVCVSDDFDVISLVKTIIARATNSSLDASDLHLEELQHRVREALNGKKFLLVLDDVWNEDREKWLELRVFLMCGGRGSRIVVTTRNPMIASIMSSIEPHNLEGLSEEDCWQLFAGRALPDRRERDHPKLVEIGKDIVNKCGGVPLAVITLGGLLSFKNNESQWESVRDSELWNLAPENVRGILPALRLSYYHLDPHLRQCFTFCAIFPKDYGIDKELLMQLWMAHGCVPSIREMELEDIGIEILNELLNRSLFQEVQEYHGGDGLKIKVHDLIHDLARSVIQNDCCIIEPGKSASRSDDFTKKKVRHLCYFEWIEDLQPFLFEVHESLRTILVMSYWNFFGVPREMAIFKFIRVLHLSISFGDPPLMASIGEFLHLRYLGLEIRPIRTLPESIGNLHNLQTLNLNGCISLRELPSGTRNLVSLRCLDIDRRGSLSHMPAKIGMLSCLRKLPLFIVGDGANVCSGIEELECLNYLKGELRIEHLERVAIPSNAQRANLIGKPNLDSLKLIWVKPYIVGDIMLAAAANPLVVEAEEEVLKGLRPHENLKELEISCYQGIHFASWMTGSLLPSIVKIILRDCTRCEFLPPLGQLPSLKFLYIECMHRVENIGKEFYGNNMSQGFPSLERLEIRGMYGLKLWSGLPGERVFPRLQIIKINNCPNLKSLPEGIENLSSLKQLWLEIVGLTSLPRGIGNLSSLEFLVLQLESLTSFPESMQELSTLRELTILSCHQLPSLPEWVGNLTALQCLEIVDCPKMVSLPAGLQHLIGLQRLDISFCPEMQRRCEETGQDFHKIQHIPNLVV